MKHKYNSKKKKAAGPFFNPYYLSGQVFVPSIFSPILGLACFSPDLIHILEKILEPGTIRSVPLAKYKSIRDANHYDVVNRYCLMKKNWILLGIMRSHTVITNQVTAALSIFNHMIIADKDKTKQLAINKPHLSGNLDDSVETSNSHLIVNNNNTTNNNSKKDIQTRTEASNSSIKDKKEGTESLKSSKSVKRSQSKKSTISGDENETSPSSSSLSSSSSSQKPDETPTKLIKSKKPELDAIRESEEDKQEENEDDNMMVEFNSDSSPQDDDDNDDYDDKYNKKTETAIDIVEKRISSPSILTSIRGVDLDIPKVDTPVNNQQPTKKKSKTLSRIFDVDHNASNLKSTKSTPPKKVKSSSQVTNNTSKQDKKKRQSKKEDEDDEEVKEDNIIGDQDEVNRDNQDKNQDHNQEQEADVKVDDTDNEDNDRIKRIIKEDSSDDENDKEVVKNIKKTKSKAKSKSSKSLKDPTGDDRDDKKTEDKNIDNEDKKNNKEIKGDEKDNEDKGDKEDKKNTNKENNEDNEDKEDQERGKLKKNSSKLPKKSTSQRMDVDEGKQPTKEKPEEDKSKDKSNKVEEKSGGGLTTGTMKEEDTETEGKRYLIACPPPDLFVQKSDILIVFAFNDEYNIEAFTSNLQRASSNNFDNLSQ
eukprot:TRINITY_DN356_c3_g2_i1.p2 TRINITY_DN356_c3_g2~~TRINITY_DN356_c3_g2_i1.p2  ORF type:complete len:647 (-),score=251.66 TRINITY_DN356_c3_g2_i1:84-2024(-)